MSLMDIEIHAPESRSAGSMMDILSVLGCRCDPEIAPSVVERIAVPMVYSLFLRHADQKPVKPDGPLCPGAYRDVARCIRIARHAAEMPFEPAHIVEVCLINESVPPLAQLKRSAPLKDNERIHWAESPWNVVSHP